MQAMILAAGLGTRLRPYSTLRPKPLFPVLNRPLLLNTIHQLRACGCRRIVINAFHLQKQIADLVVDETDIILQKEETLLGTGGGLKQARKCFSSEHVLVVNGDICHSIDLQQVMNKHKQNRHNSPVSLVSHDCRRFNSVIFENNGQILSFDKEYTLKHKQKKLAFTGIHVIDPQILDKVPPGIFYNIIDCYKELIQAGIPINGIEEKDHYWTDMGTPEDYLNMHQHFLTESKIGYWLNLSSTSPFLVHESSTIGSDVKFNDWVCIGAEAQIEDGADLTRVVVWDGAHVPAGSILQDTVVP